MIRAFMIGNSSYTILLCNNPRFNGHLYPPSMEANQWVESFLTKLGEENSTISNEECASLLPAIGLGIMQRSKGLLLYKTIPLIDAPSIRNIIEEEGDKMFLLVVRRNFATSTFSYLIISVEE